MVEGPHDPTLKLKDKEFTRIVPKTKNNIPMRIERRLKRIKKQRSCYSVELGLPCESAKKILGCLCIAHKVTLQVKESKVNVLTTQFENFTMKEENSFMICILGFHQSSIIN